MFHGLTMVNFDGQTQSQMMVRPWSAMVAHGLMVRLSQGNNGLFQKGDKTGGISTFSCCEEEEHWGWPTNCCKKWCLYIISYQ